MDGHDDGAYAREPQLEDLARIAAALNSAGARYVLIGGFAVIAHGASRTTNDIDLLIDPAPANVKRVREALRILADRAVDEVSDDDVAEYTVVRVADELVVDLMAKACGIDCTEALLDAETIYIDGVPVIVASPSTLVRTKNTIRASDAADRQYLLLLIEERSR